MAVIGGPTGSDDPRLLAVEAWVPPFTGAVAPYISQREAIRNKGVLISENKALGDNSTDNTGNIQQVINDVASWGGGKVRIDRNINNGGWYKTGELQLKSDVSIIGDGKETSRLIGSGNAPVLSFIGGSGNALRRPIIRDLQIRGAVGATAMEKAVGIMCSWSGGLVIKDVDFRALRLGIYLDYSANPRLSDIDLTGCHDGIWFGPLDQALYPPTPDNTVLMNNVAGYSTLNTGLRATGMTGLKAVQCLFLGGQIGWHIGEYDPAVEPLVKYFDGDVSKVPNSTNARIVRFLHLTNCFSDSNARVGWRLRGLTPDKPLQDSKFVNCWGGNTSTAAGSDNLGFDLDNFQHVIISSTIQTYVGKSTFSIKNGSNLTITGCEGYNHNRLSGGDAAFHVENVNNYTITSIVGGTDFGTNPLEAFVLRLKGCSAGSVVGVQGNNIPAVDLVDTTDTQVIACSTSHGTSVAVREGGTSDRNNLSACRAAGGNTVIGPNTSVNNSGSYTAPRTSFRGGSPTQPAIYREDNTDCGWYAQGGSGILYGADGAAQFGLIEDGGIKRFLFLKANIPTFVDNAAAVAGGLLTGRLFLTAAVDGNLRVRS